MENTVTISIDKFDGLRNREKLLIELKHAIGKQKNIFVERWWTANSKTQKDMYILSDEEVATKLNSYEKREQESNKAIDELRAELNQAKQNELKTEEQDEDVNRYNWSRMAISFAAGLLSALIIAQIF